MTRALVACLALSCLAAPVAAGDDALPTAEAVLDAYARAMGGAEAYARVNTMVARGRLEIVGMGVSGPLTLSIARPASSAVVFRAEALGSVRSGTNGDIAWEVSDLQGARLLEGAEKAFAIRSGLLDAPVRWRELYPKVDLLGVETVDGVECYALRLEPAEGAPETWYVERATSLLRKSTTTLSHAMGEIPVEATTSDYRRVDGVMVPFVASQKMLMQEMRTVLDSVELNVAIPPEALAVPPEVAALIAAQGGERQGARGE